MKIAFFVYPSAFQNKGGGEILLEKTEEYLIKKGIEVKRFDMWTDEVQNYDILHVFGSVKECLGLMRTAKARGVKVVLESVFWSDYRRAFHEEGTIKKKIEMVLRHTAKIVFPFMPSGRRSMFLTSDMIVPNSLNEARQISRLFAVGMDKMFVVPNGVDEDFMESRPEEFVKKYGLKDFVLSVGRIEPRKNQLNLIRAMKGIDADLVIVGNTVSGYEWYRDLCTKEADRRVHFIEGLSHSSNLLKSAYAASDTFVLPGWFETPGLAALEAALAGSKVVATKGGSTKEYFMDKVLYIDPSSPRDIHKKVSEAVRMDKNTSLKELVLNNYTWEKATEKMLQGYRKVIEK